MKTKGILLPVLLLILMNSTIVGLGVPTILSPTGNQTTILPIQERDLNLRPHQDLSMRSHRILQKSAANAFPQYEEHDPIIIKSDADFVTLGFPGDGSPENPYIIEGLNITRSMTPLIQIEDTTVYFHLRNNFLNGLPSEGPIPEGIHLIDVSHGTITSNIITNCVAGILIKHSKEIIVSHNTVSNNRLGIILSYSEYNLISHNTISNSSLCGIYLSRSGNNTAIHNTVSNTRSIIGNISRPHGPIPDGTGFYLAFSGNNTVSHNIISNNSGDGLHLWYLNDTIISDNTVLTNGGAGIYIENDSDNNIISNNTISNNGWIGIYLRESGLNSLLGNNLINNGLFIDCWKIEKCSKTNVTDNMVNGRPLVYWQNVIGRTIPPGAGQVILINTTAVEVTGQDLSRASIGLFAIFSSNLYIHHNIASNNSRTGIYLRDVGNSTLSHNTVSNNGETGIDLRDVGNSTLSHNTVSNNGETGIVIASDSDNNGLSNNTVSNNGETGIVLGISEQNTVKWNNFLGNNPEGGSQARDKGTDNVFTNNYWDDHDNTDRDGDGLADTSYAIEGAANNQDSFPLAVPAVMEATTLPKVPEFEGFLIFIVIPFLLSSRIRVWYRKRKSIS